MKRRHTIDPWGQVPPRVNLKRDKYAEARAVGLKKIGGINVESLDEAENVLLHRDGGECRNYGGLLVSGMAQTLTIVIILVGVLFVLGIWI